MSSIQRLLSGCASSFAEATSQRAMLTREVSSRFDLPTSSDTLNATSSPALEAGPSPCTSPDGLMTGRSGPAHAPVSHSARPDSRWVVLIRAIYGQRSAASSIGADLQLSLESRLQARLDVGGSPEYVLTWKRWAMSHRQPICALRASVPRTSGKDSTGWPTPTCPSVTEGHEAGNNRFVTKTKTLVGWLTPSANEDAAGNPDAAMQAMLGSQSKRMPERERERALVGQLPRAETTKTEVQR